MWSEDWGTMLWGGGVAVPTLGPVAWAFLFGALVGVGGLVLMQQRRLSRAHAGALLIAVALVPLAAAAVTIPNTFTNGTVADAGEASLFL